MHCQTALCATVLFSSPWLCLAESYPVSAPVAASTAPVAPGLERPPTPWMLPDTTIEPQLATITADTGAFAPGHRDFARYDTPLFCEEAALSARATAKRRVAAQALEDTLAPFSDTVGLAAAGGVARACGARFTLANTPVGVDRDDLFDLAVLEQNDSLALAILAGQPLQSWSYGLRQFGKYGRRAAAQVLLARADAEGAAGRQLQLTLHTVMRELYLGQATEGSHLAHEDSVLIAQGRQQRGLQGYVSVLNGYRDLMRHAIATDTSQIPALARAAKRDLSAYGLQDQPADLNALAHGLGLTTDAYDYGRDRGDWSAMSVDSATYKLAPSWWAHIRYGGGHPAPRLQADFWWPASDSGTPSGAAPVVPVRGKVNLICGGGEITNNTNSVFNGHQMESAYRQAIYLKHWQAQYGPMGLVVTLVRPASGAPQFDYHAQRVSRNVIVKDSTEEAAFWHWYDQVYHQIPAIEAVKVIHTTQWLPQPDGRRLYVSESVPNGYIDLAKEMFANSPQEAGTCTLVGRDGTILYRHNDERLYFDWLGWDEVLHWLFSGTVARIVSPATGARPISAFTAGLLP